MITKPKKFFVLVDADTQELPEEFRLYSTKEDAEKDRDTDNQIAEREFVQCVCDGCGEAYDNGEGGTWFETAEQIQEWLENDDDGVITIAGKYHVFEDCADECKTTIVVELDAKLEKLTAAVLKCESDIRAWPSKEQYAVKLTIDEIKAAGGLI